MVVCFRSGTGYSELIKHLIQKNIRYGLDRYYPNEKDEDLVALLKKPFQKLDG